MMADAVGKGDGADTETPVYPGPTRKDVSMMTAIAPDVHPPNR